MRDDAVLSRIRDALGRGEYLLAYDQAHAAAQVSEDRKSTRLNSSH